MTEFVIGTTLLLIPVFLIVPLLGKYLDMRSATIQGARYIAWERTVWYGGAASTNSKWTQANFRSEADIRTRMGQLFFESNYTDAVWRDRAGNALRGTYNATLPASESTPGIVDDFLSPIIGITSFIGGFNLELNGLYTGTVTFNALNTTPIRQVLGTEVGGLQEWGALGLSFTDKNVILANGWSAKGSSHVTEQVRGLTPTSILSSPAGTIITTLIQVLFIPYYPEVAPGYLEPGKIVVDTVPYDRTQ